MEPIPNVTVTVGRDASLPCVISNLGTYKVVWIHIDRQMVLTMHKHVITRIPRYSISVNENTWVLHVTRVQQDDRGYYMCQVNTNPIISQVGYLQVTVPPVFIDDGSTTSATVIIRENENLTLSCRAQGFPQPKIVWKREDGRDIVLSKKMKGSVFSGEFIHFEKISRNDMSGYLCIAANGVPPALIKKIFVNVQFSPIILVTNQLIASTIGSTVILECQTEANPIATTYWIRNGHFLSQNSKHTIYASQRSYQMYSKLEIHNVSKSNFGEYTCLSKNSLGETEGTVRLYEYVISTTNEAATHKTTRIPVTGSTAGSSIRQTADTSVRHQYNEKSLQQNLSSSQSGGHIIIQDIYTHPKVMVNLGNESLYPCPYVVFGVVLLICRF